MTISIIALMTYKDIQHYFQNKLSSLYSPDEINHLYYILTEHICGLTKLQLLLQHNSFIQRSHHDELQRASERLLLHEPVEYIIGTAYFYGRTFKVSQDVLIPRPETEELVNYVEVNFLQHSKTPCAILDIGTGSGCIAVTLKKLFPNADVVATDISERAIDIAKHNAAFHQANVHFECIDMLIPPPLHFYQRFDTIVSNPPYVLKNEVPEISNRVKCYEPHLALFASEEDDILHYKSLSHYFQLCLKPDGNWIVEVNDSLAEKVLTYFQDIKLKNVEIVSDIYKKKRFVKGRK